MARRHIGENGIAAVVVNILYPQRADRKAGKLRAAEQPVRLIFAAPVAGDNAHTGQRACRLLSIAVFNIGEACGRA